MIAWAVVLWLVGGVVFGAIGLVRWANERRADRIVRRRLVDDGWVDMGDGMWFKEGS